MASESTSASATLRDAKPADSHPTPPSAEAMALLREALGNYYEHGFGMSADLAKRIDTLLGNKP